MAFGVKPWKDMAVNFQMAAIMAHAQFVVAKIGFASMIKTAVAHGSVLNAIRNLVVDYCCYPGISASLRLKRPKS
ncbi:hypothetical protein D3C73_577000 [compost metagenome]